MGRRFLASSIGALAAVSAVVSLTEAPVTGQAPAAKPEAAAAKRPWTAVLRLKHTTDKIYEYACHEGNESIVGILGGARAQEKAAAAKTGSR